MALKHPYLTGTCQPCAEGGDGGFHKDGAGWVIPPHILVDEGGHAAVECDHDLLCRGMALQHLRILLMVAARHAYDDVIGLADRLVDIRGDYVDAFPCFQCTDALNDLGICEIAESMDEVFRRKQPHFMSACF